MSATAGARKSHAAGRDVPPLWRALMVRWFSASPALAVELWRAYQAMMPFTSKTTGYELNRMLGSCPEDALWQRAERLLAVLNPKDMLAASLRLAPEVGNRRRRDVLAYEETVLERLDANGKWRIL